MSDQETLGFAADVCVPEIPFSGPPETGITLPSDTDAAIADTGNASVETGDMSANDALSYEGRVAETSTSETENMTTDDLNASELGNQFVPTVDPEQDANCGNLEYENAVDANGSMVGDVTADVNVERVGCASSDASKVEQEEESLDQDCDDDEDDFNVIIGNEQSNIAKVALF